MSPNFPGSVLDPSLDALPYEERCDLWTTNYTEEEMLRLYTHYYDYEDEDGFVTVNDLGLEGHAGLGKLAVFD
jgi:hypothetical protein